MAEATIQVVKEAPTYLHPEAMPLPQKMLDLHKYEALISAIPSIGPHNAPYYMKMFLEGKDLASGLHARALFEYERSKAEAKEQHAVAYLERSIEYFKQRDIKPTDELRKQYVQTDSHYKTAKETEDYNLAMMTLLEGKVYKFNAAHEDARAIFQKTKDPHGSSVGAASGPNAQ